MKETKPAVCLCIHQMQVRLPVLFGVFSVSGLPVAASILQILADRFLPLNPEEEDGKEQQSSR